MFWKMIFLCVPNIKKCFLTLFSRLLPNTRKWISFIENVFWKMSRFPKDVLCRNKQSLSVQLFTLPTILSTKAWQSAALKIPKGTPCTSHDVPFLIPQQLKNWAFMLLETPHKKTLLLLGLGVRPEGVSD